MQRINSECDKRKKYVDCQIVPVSYFCRLNTPKGTARAPTGDFSWLNTLRRHIRHTKIMEERVTEKHIAQRRIEGEKVLQVKLHCRANKLY